MGKLKPLSEDLVGVDIDGKDAITANAFIYGQESSGISHPVHVDNNGDIIISGSSGTTVYGDKIPTASCAAGAAIQFDITSFYDLVTLNQVGITQLVAGTYNYTLEIWEKDSGGYTPGTYTDHYLKIFSRDIDVREYRENIDMGLLYRDRDATGELHMRIINTAAPLGTTSAFNISIVGTISG